MRITQRSWKFVISTALAATLWAQGTNAQDAVPGITDATIKIGVTGPLTGPVAVFGAVDEGIRTKIEAINAAGGVKMGDGKTRKIELVIADDALDPQRTLSNVRRLVESDQVFALIGTAATPNNEAIARYVDKGGVPNLFMYSGIHELKNGNQWSIGLAPSFTTEAAVFAEYVKTTKPDAKVGLLFLNTETGLTFSAGLKATLEGSSVKIVSEQPVTATDPTIDTQLSNLKASGADTLIVIAPPKQAGQAVKFAAESGWHPETLLSYIGSSVFALMPAGLENAKGVLTSQFIKPIELPAFASDAGVKQYIADHDAVKPRFETGDALGQMGYLTGDALIHVLEAMKAPSRQAMMDAARNMKQVEIGLLLPGITLTTDGQADIYSIESLQLFQFDGERYQPVGDVVSYEGKTPKI
jgi:branched-chain amino acid transport system substrate-binding protein